MKFSVFFLIISLIPSFSWACIPIGVSPQYKIQAIENALFLGVAKVERRQEIMSADGGVIAGSRAYEIELKPLISYRNEGYPDKYVIKAGGCGYSAPPEGSLQQVAVYEQKNAEDEYRLSFVFPYHSDQANTDLQALFKIREPHASNVVAGLREQEQNCLKNNGTWLFRDRQQQIFGLCKLEKKEN